MKRVLKTKLGLNRETLQRLDDETLKQPLGGNFRKQYDYPTYTCPYTYPCLP
jgi:hypothetical protein